jgi:hypothetical protein
MSSAWFATRPSPLTWPDHACVVGSRAVLVAIAPGVARPTRRLLPCRRMPAWARYRSRLAPGVGAGTVVSVPALAATGHP